ncbi:MAG TPA: hypothetical protein VMZ28_20715 [Kofleriaceae bacterium]|nr:hypothetical protein [Kofleriaceae bacterium]
MVIDLRGALLVALALAPAACLEAGAVVCADGLVCPSGTRCDVEHEPPRCLAPGQLDACDGVADGDDCDHPGGGTGYCDGGACVLAFCGDGSIAPSESCEIGDVPLSCADLGFYHDDGTSSVACTAFCQLDTTGCRGRCGDGIIDVAFGESCEGDASPPGSCVDEGFDRGRLACDQCAPGHDGCDTFGWDPDWSGTLVTFVAAASAGDELFVIGEDTSPGEGNVALVHHDGTTWEVMKRWDHPAGRVLFIDALFASSSSDLWLVGTSWDEASDFDGVIYHFDGDAWDELTVPDRRFVDVWASGPDDVFVMGVAGPALSFDGGALEVRRFDGDDWSAEVLTGTIDSELLPAGLTGTGAGDVYAATAYHGVFHHDGDTWAPLAPPDDLRDVHALAAGEVYFGARDGEVHRWDGDGFTSTGSVAAPGTNYQLGGTPASGLHAFGADGVATYAVHRHDGVRWWDVTHGLDFFPTAGAVVGDTMVLTSGDGMAARFSGSVWSPLELAGFPAATVGSVWAFGPDDVFAVSGQGDVWHNDGAGWQLSLAVDDARNVMWGAEGELFVYSDDGIYHLEDGVWSAPVAMPGYVLDLSGSGPDDVYAVGFLGLIAHWNGVEWTVVQAPSGSTTDLRQVACRPDGECYASGAVLVRTDGGGAAWEVVETDLPAGVVTNMTDLWVSPDSDDLWMVGDSGVTVRASGGAWSVVASGTSETLHALFGTGQEDVFATGEHGLILHHDGVDWSPVRPPDRDLEGEQRVTGGAGAVLFHGVPGDRIDVLLRFEPW